MFDQLDHFIAVSSVLLSTLFALAAGPSGKSGVSSILLSAPGFDHDFGLWSGPVFAMLEACVGAISGEEMVGIVCFHPLCKDFVFAFRARTFCCRYDTLVWYHVRMQMSPPMESPGPALVTCTQSPASKNGMSSMIRQRPLRRHLRHLSQTTTSRRAGPGNGVRPTPLSTSCARNSWKWPKVGEVREHCTRGTSKSSTSWDEHWRRI